MLIHGNFEFTNLHESIYSASEPEPVDAEAALNDANTETLDGHEDAQVLKLVSGYVTETDKIGEYLYAQVKLDKASAEEVKNFFAYYAPNVIRGDEFKIMEDNYENGVSYNVYYMRDLDLEEIVAVALVRNMLGLSHVDIYVEPMDIFDFDQEEDCVAFGEYLSALIEFIWLVLARVIPAHRPEDNPRIIFDFRDSEVLKCLINSPKCVVPEEYKDVNLDMCCDESKVENS